VDGVTTWDATGVSAGGEAVLQPASTSSAPGVIQNKTRALASWSRNLRIN
jgi:hypothetical protein